MPNKSTSSTPPPDPHEYSCGGHVAALSITRFGYAVRTPTPRCFLIAPLAVVPADVHPSRCQPRGDNRATPGC